MVIPHAGAVYWSEARPLEGGRDAIVVRCPRPRAGRRARRRLQRPYARARVRRRRASPCTPGPSSSATTPISASTASTRAASRGRSRRSRIVAVRPALRRPAGHARRRGTIVCVREREAQPEHVNELVALPADGSAEPRVIEAGHDFYAAPRVSPDGDAARLAGLGSPADALGGLRALGGSRRTAAARGAWPAARARRSCSRCGARSGVLHFGSDRDGWWNLYRLAPDGVRAGHDGRRGDRRADVGVRPVLVRLPAPTGGSSARSRATAATSWPWSSAPAAAHARLRA